MVSAAVSLGLPVVLWAAWHVFALWRFYRRFLYETESGLVWGLADDVYISASFGRSLVRGHGLLWYAGAPHVEGITNPLWSVIVGVLHWLPGCDADHLGAYVLGVNALLLTAACWFFWTTLRRHARSAFGWLWTLPLLPLSAAVSYWSAEGFEIAFLALCTFALLHCAQARDTLGHRALFSLLLTAGVATRMDFPLLAAPAALLYVRRHGVVRTRWVWLGTFALIAGLLCLRFAYYGAWLPNTYWLKATGWPLRARLERGLAQNAALLAIVPLPWLLLTFGPVRRHLVHKTPHALAAWLGFTSTALYSTYVGGDAWQSMAGYDRHTALGGLLLIWGCAGLVLSVDRRWALAALVSLVCAGVAAWPVLRVDLPRTLAGLFQDGGQREYEREWIAYGKVFGEISRRGARIAVCPAGAIVYFAERGGVDLLGKVDPFVAHLEVSTRRPKDNVCWRNAPGHNKEDDVRMFELRKPDFSRYQPPPASRPLYAKLKHKNMRFFVLHDSPYLIKPGE